MNDDLLLGTINRSDLGPPEPYRSQSAAIQPQRYRPGNGENGTNNNRPPSATNRPATTRRPSNEQRHSTSRSSGGRAKSTRPFRDTIRSAVPDTAIITIAKRPDRGGTGKFETDHFLYENSSRSSWSFYHSTDQSFQMSCSSNIEMSSV